MVGVSPVFALCKMDQFTGFFGFFVVIPRQCFFLFNSIRLLEHYLGKKKKTKQTNNTNTHIVMLN